MVRRLVALTALTFFALLALAGPASAHVELPTANGEVLLPSRLTLTAAPNGPSTTAEATTSTTEAVLTTTTDALPGTTLEADQRDDGVTSMAPWIIGSGIAAVLVIAIGGLFLKQQQDRRDEQDRAAASGRQPAEPEK